MGEFVMNMSLSNGSTLTGADQPLTDANAQRIIAAHRIRYNMPTNSTAQQVWSRISDDVFDMLKTRTINSERDTQTAAITIAPLT